MTTRHALRGSARPARTITPLHAPGDGPAVEVLDSQIDDCERELRSQRALIHKLRQYRLNLAPATALLDAVQARLQRLRLRRSMTGVAPVSGRGRGGS